MSLVSTRLQRPSAAYASRMSQIPSPSRTGERAMDNAPYYTAGTITLGTKKPRHALLRVEGATSTVVAWFTEREHMERFLKELTRGSLPNRGAGR